MRKQFGNKTAVPVEVGQRVIARLIMTGLVLLGYAVSMLGTAWAISSYAYDAVAVINGIVMVYSLVLGALSLYFWIAKSTSLGGKLRGFHFIKDDTGEDAKALVLAKYLIESVFEGATLGLGMISYFVSYREGQHWLDRAFKVTAVADDSIELAFAQQRVPAVAPGPQQPRVMPVTMPPAASPTPQQASGFDPRRPVSPDQQQRAAQETQPAPSPVPPRPSTPIQAQEQPARNDFAPANPWALPGQLPAAPADREPEQPPFVPQSGSVAPARPSPSFVPLSSPAVPTQPSPPFVPQPEPMIPAPRVPTVILSSSPLDDETVIDADIAAEHAPSVVLDDGEVLRVDGPIVLGRNPVAPTAYPQARPVAVTDESMRMSKTHLVLVPADGGIGVFDVGATNGVHLEVDGNRTRIPVGELQTVPADAALHFGGRTLKVAP